MKKICGVALMALLLVGGFIISGAQPVAAASTSGSCLIFNTDLAYGASGSSVTSLQAYLQANGYLNDAPTGYFGDETAAALVKFQSAVGIQATGYFGPITRAYIASTSCNSYSPTSGGSTSLVPGCTSYTGYSSTTGQSCAGTSTVVGCASNVGYSPITGQSCAGLVPTTYPPGCISYTGYSVITGQSCSGTTTTYPPIYPPGCTSFVGYSSTTGAPCNASIYINSISPQSGPVGTTVTLNGLGFSSSGNTVNFSGGVIQNVPSTNGNSISFNVPSTINPSCLYSHPSCDVASFPVSAGNYDVSVTNSAGQTTNVVSFTVTADGLIGPPVTCTSGSNCPLALTSLSPSSGPANTSVTIYGTGFNTNSVYNQPPCYSGQPCPEDYVGNEVYLDGTNIAIANSSNGTSMTVTIPAYISGACFNSYPGYCNPTVKFSTGPHTLTVSSNGVTSNGLTFTITGGTATGKAPSITSLSPTSGPIGTSVTIHGIGFDTTLVGNCVDNSSGSCTANNSILIDGIVAATAESSNGTTLTFSVPSYLNPPCPSGQTCPIALPALLPGPHSVTVKDLNGTSNALTFNLTAGGCSLYGNVYCGPVLSSLSPTSGVVGTRVTISGANFTPTNNRIKFGSYTAVISAPSTNDDSITFTVPVGLSFCDQCDALVQTQPQNYAVSVQNTNGTSYPVNFTVTSTSSSSASIQMISPNGGENLVVGQTYTITWSSHNIASNQNVSLALGNDDSTEQGKIGAANLQPNIAYDPFTPSSGKYVTDSFANLPATVSNSGSYVWHVPSNLPTGSHYYMVISQTVQNGNFDASNGRFSISSASVNTYSLTLSKTGQGSGTITSSPAGISCGSTCSHSFNSGTSVILTAVQNGGTFTGWSGACTGNSLTCTISMNAAKNVTASFSQAFPPPTASLTVNNSHNFTAHVGDSITYAWSSTNGALFSSSYTSHNSVTGASCGSGPWIATTNSGNRNIVLATPAANCTYTITYQVVGAVGNAYDTIVLSVLPATQSTYTLTISRGGAGTGMIISSPSGIICGGTCSHAFSAGTSVTLTAFPASGVFTGWTGACTGSASTCTVTMNAAKTVTATFSLSIQPPTATLTANGSHNITLHVGNTVQYVWSSTNATQFSSSYTSHNSVTGASCGSGPWTATTNSGNHSGVLGAASANCTYTITYHVVGAEGDADDTIILKVLPSNQGSNAIDALNSLIDMGKVNQTASINEAINALLANLRSLLGQ